MMTRRPNALLTFVALVAVLVLALVGHRLLTERKAQEAQSAASVSSEAAADEETTADDETADEVYLLADFDATVYTEQNEARTLTEIADGHPLVVNFWATWCPYCVEELPDFQEIYAEYGDRVNFAFVDVADGARERVEDAQAWLSEQGFDDLPVYFDSALEASDAFGAYALPMTVMVKADGEILVAQAGRIDPILVRGQLEQMV